MKIGFITDTNILTKKQGEDKSKLYNQERFLDYIDFFTNYIDDLNSIKTKKELIYLMPETILEELSFQKIEAYNESYETLCKKYQSMEYALKGKLPKNNILEIVSNEKRNYSGKVKIIKLKYQNKIYRELVKEALNKLPPFDKSEGNRKSDAGFKDALIWKTIEYSEEINNYDVVYYFSGDRIFEKNAAYLINEFKKRHPKTNLIIRYINPDDEKLQNCLKVIIDENNLPETDCVKLYNKQYILEFIRNLENNFTKDVKLNKVVYGEKKICLRKINFENFEIKDFKIENVEKINNNFIIDVKFDTKHYEIIPEEVILTEKRSIKGMIKFEFSKNKEKFILKSSKIVEVRFGETLQEILQRISNNIVSLNISNSANVMLENINNAIKPLRIAYENALKNNFTTLFPNYYLEDNLEENEKNQPDDNDENKD